MHLRPIPAERSHDTPRILLPARMDDAARHVGGDPHRLQSHKLLDVAD